MFKNILVGMILITGLMISGCDTTEGSTVAKSDCPMGAKKACKLKCSPEQIAACKKACEGLSPEECKAKCKAAQADCGGKNPATCSKKASQCDKGAAQCGKKKACPPDCTKPCCAKTDEAEACPPGCTKPCCAA